MKLIQEYLKAHGGAVYTQMLIDHFNRYCGSPERTAEFKEMLKVIAVLDKGDGAASVRGARGGMGRMARQATGRGGRGKWVLRKEYGGTA
jgi:DNA excision repair protein ERCC-6